MGSFAGSAEVAVPLGFLDNLLLVVGGVDGLVGAFFGSVGNAIGVTSPDLP